MQEIQDQDARNCYFCGKRILKRLSKSKNYRKVRDHCQYTGTYRDKAHCIRNLKFNVPYEIPVVFHNGSNCDYHFIAKELAKEFEGEFKCCGKVHNSKKTFFVLIKMEVTKIDKDGNESVVTISYKIRFINSTRFMASLLSNLVDNLVEGIYEIKGKDCDCFLKYESVKAN